MRRVSAHSRQGFSLLEVLMGSIVLAIALVGLLSAIFHIYRLNEAARENDLALQGATEMMERLMSESDNLSTLYANYNGTGFDVRGLSQVAGDPDGKVGLVTIDNSNPDLLSATVQVAWRGRSGNRSIQLESRLTERE